MSHGRNPREVQNKAPVNLSDIRECGLLQLVYSAPFVVRLNFRVPTVSFEFSNECGQDDSGGHFQDSISLTKTHCNRRFQQQIEQI